MYQATETSLLLSSIHPFRQETQSREVFTEGFCCASFSESSLKIAKLAWTQVFIGLFINIACL
jgi:hypothetical protein